MTVEAIAEALSAEGFRPCPPKRRGAHCFTGNISCNDQPVPVEIEIADLDFVELPKIRVLQRPDKLVGFQPHFGVNDEFCYADKGRIVLDKYRPAESIVGCLEKASTVLTSLASKHPPDDVRDEFLAYWPGQPLFVTCEPDHKGSASVISMHTKGAVPVLIASENPAIVTDQLTRLGWSVSAAGNSNCYVIKSLCAPTVFTKEWPPRTIGDLLNWIREIDAKAHRTIHQELASKWVLKSGLAAFVLRSPTVDYGFWFEVDRIHAKTCQRKPSLYRDFLIGRGAKTRVTLLTGYRFDQQFVHARNLTDGKNLRNKRVLIAGCGTIGGYLATYLARLGAGQGTQGRLILADPDILVPANIGRHVLGMGSLLENKAEAVADVIRRDFPYLNVIARPADVRLIKEIYEVDILIDASGEEALSTALNERLIQRRQEKKENTSGIACVD